MSGIRLDLAFLLNQSAYAFSARLGTRLREIGLNVREFCVLMKAAEEPRTQNAVAELAGLDKTTMVSTLDRLERDGLAVRSVSAADRRARMVEVTASGKKVLQRAYVVYDEVVEETLGALEPGVRTDFVEALQVLTTTTLSSPSHTAPQRRKLPAAARQRISP